VPCHWHNGVFTGLFLPNALTGDNLMMQGQDWKQQHCVSRIQHEALISSTVQIIMANYCWQMLSLSACTHLSAFVALNELARLQKQPLHCLYWYTGWSTLHQLLCNCHRYQNSICH
jgi:hypothetical protein